MHADHHPTPVDGCFGCKVSTVGFDGGHLERVTTTPRAVVTEYRDGRQAVEVRPRGVRAAVQVRNED